MNYPNSPRLSGWLKGAGWGPAADAEGFVISDEAMYAEHLTRLRGHTAEETLSDRAAFWYLTFDPPGSKVAGSDRAG